MKLIFNKKHLSKQLYAKFRLSTHLYASRLSYEKSNEEHSWKAKFIVSDFILSIIIAEIKNKCL